MSNLVKLIQNLNEDSSLKERYLQDPETVIDEFNCTAEEKEALLTRDENKLRALVGDHAGDAILAPE